MSHKATAWAIQQRGLDPATKLLLWYLADCHNSHTGRCDPSQDRLADECEMGRASINRHLDKLEIRGLIRRVRRVNSDTKRQESTSYELAMDHVFDRSEGEAVSQNDTRVLGKPCLKNEGSRVSNSAVSVSHSCETLTCKRTGNRTSKREREGDLFSADQTPPAPKPDIEAQFQTFWNAYPVKSGKPAAHRNFLKAVKAGADPAAIIRGAERYRDWLSCAAPGEFRPQPKYPQGWLTDERWNDLPEVEALDPARARLREITRQANAAAHRTN